MASFNLDGAWWDVVHKLIAEGKHYAGFQESHLTPDSPTPRLAGCRVFRAEDKSEPKRGVIVTVSPSVGGRQYEYKRRKGSEIWVLSTGFPFSEGRPGLVGSVHLHSQSPKEWARLKRFLIKRRRRYLFIMMTDMNFRLTAGVDYSKSYDGGVAQDEISRFLREVGGRIPGYKGQPGSHLCRGKLNAIDCVIFSKELDEGEPSARVRLDLFGADHFPVEVSWRALGSYVAEVTKRRGLSERQQTKLAQCVVTTLRDQKPSTLDDVTDVVSGVCKQWASRPAKHKRVNKTPVTQKLRRRMELALADRTLHPGPVGTEAVKAARRELKKAIWTERVESWQLHITELAEMAKSDTRVYFRECKKLGHMREPRMTNMAVTDQAGVHLVGEEAEKHMTHHFEAILSPRPEHDETFKAGMEQMKRDHVRDEDKEAHWMFVLAPFLEEELTEAITLQPTYTAVGPDEVPASVWKALWQDDECKSVLLAAANRFLESGKFPERWRLSTLVLLNKIPKPVIAKDYRGIAITNTLYRLVLRVIQGRMKCALETSGGLSPSQFAFRSGRSTLDAIAAFHDIVYRRLVEQLGTYVLFIDFAAAYDSVSMEALECALLLQHVPRELQELLLQCYSYSDVKIPFPSGNEARFKGTCGLRQGCSLSPLLFLIVIEQLIRELRKYAGIYVPGVDEATRARFNDQQPLNNIFFADDGAVMTASALELQILTDVVVRMSRKWGLQLNTRKCVVMTFSRRGESDTRIMIGNSRVPNAASFKYLGCVLSSTLASKDTMEARLVAARQKTRVLGVLCKRLYYAERSVREKKVGCGTLQMMKSATWWAKWRKWSLGHRPRVVV